MDLRRKMDIVMLILIINLFLLTARALDSPPKITLQPPNLIYFKENSPVVLNCKADDISQARYRWITPFEKYPRSSNGTGTYILIRPTVREQGYYQCMAINNFGASLSLKTRLVMAQLEDVQATPARDIVIREGSSIRLSCQTSHSVPEGTIRWRYRHKNGVSDIEESDHLIVLDYQQHHLLIVDARPQDGNKEYFCAVFNDMLEREISLPGHRLRVLKTTGPKQKPLQWMATTSALRISLVGDSISLHCVATFSNVRWSREVSGKWIDINSGSRRIFIKAGTGLQLIKVSKHDAGKYRCSVQHGNKTIEKSMTLIVRERPRWVQKPKDAVLPMFASHVVECVVGGDPKPTVRWTINGRGANNDPRIKLRGNKLYLKKVKRSMSIQCNGSNSYGYVFTNALIIVTKSPTIYPKLPEITYKTIGETGILRCPSIGNTMNFMSWEMNGHMVFSSPKSNRKIMRDGSMKIRKFSKLDNGIYTCSVINGFGADKSSTAVIVRERTEIVQGPQDLFIKEGDTARFECTAKTDVQEKRNLMVNWKASGISRNSPMENGKSVLVINRVRPSNSGAISCIVTNGIDKAEATAILRVFGRPDSPTEIKVDCSVNNNEIEAYVSWRPPSRTNYSPVRAYTVEYAVSDHSNVWYQIENDNSTIRNETTCDIPDTFIEVSLPVGKSFMFRVRAENSYGVSEFSEQSRYCEIKSKESISSGASVDEDDAVDTEEN